MSFEHHSRKHNYQSLGNFLRLQRAEDNSKNKKRPCSMTVPRDNKTIKEMLNISLIVSLIFSVHLHLLFSSHHLNLNSSLSLASSYSPAGSQLLLSKKADNVFFSIFPIDFDLSIFKPQIINSGTDSLLGLLHHFKDLVNIKNINRQNRPRDPPSI